MRSNFLSLNSIFSRMLRDNGIEPFEKKQLVPGTIHTLPPDVARDLGDRIEHVIFEKEEKIIISLDYDDTMIDLAESMRQKKIILNVQLIDFLAQMLNRHGADNFDFIILSARATDDHIKQNRETDQDTPLIEDALDEFLLALNKKVENKNAAIKIEAKNIYCLLHNRNYDSFQVEFFTIDQTGNKKIIECTEPCMAANLATHVAEWKSEHEHLTRRLSLQYEIKIVPHTNKANFIRMHYENTLIIHVDDNRLQIGEIEKLGVSNVVTIQVEPKPPRPVAQPIAAVATCHF